MPMPMPQKVEVVPCGQKWHVVGVETKKVFGRWESKISALIDADRINAARCR